MSTRKKPEPSTPENLEETLFTDLAHTNDRVGELANQMNAFQEQLESTITRARTLYQDGVTRAHNVHKDSLKAIEQSIEKRIAPLEVSMLVLQELVKRELASQSCDNKKLDQVLSAFRIDTRETQESICAYLAQTVILIRTWIEATLKPKLKKKHRKAVQKKLMPVIQELMDNLTWGTEEEAEDE